MIAHPGSTQAINPYSYVENNPLNKTDPTGMMSNCMSEGICDSVTIVGLGTISAGAAANNQQQSQQQQKPQDNTAPTGSGQPQGTIAENSGNTYVSKHNFTGQAPKSAGGDQYGATTSSPSSGTASTSAAKGLGKIAKAYLDTQVTINGATEAQQKQIQTMLKNGSSPDCVGSLS